MTVTLTLPMPPSLNNGYINVRGHGRVPSKRYTEWRIAAGMMVNVQRPAHVQGPVELEYAFGTDTRADLGNLEKFCTDLLVSSLIIDGDSKKTVKRISMWWADHLGVKVTIRRDNMAKTKVGQRVKLSEQAFHNGVYAKTATALELVGTVLRQSAGDDNLWVVKWDQKKTPVRLHQDFLMGANTHRY